MIGIILAGGRSIRFGSDKSLYYDEQLQDFWIARIVKKMTICTDDLFIVASSTNRFEINKICPDFPDSHLLLDKPPYQEQGPLSALYSVSALFPMETEYLIVPVDYPYLSTDSLIKLGRTTTNCFAVNENQKPHFTVGHITFSKKTITTFLASGKRRYRDFLNDLTAQPYILPTNELQNINYMRSVNYVNKGRNE